MITRRGLLESFRKYWYVIARVDGRKVILGPYSSQDDAYQSGYSKIDGDFDTRELPTKDLGRAVRMLRLDDDDIRDSFQRTRHTI